MSKPLSERGPVLLFVADEWGVEYVRVNDEIAKLERQRDEALVLCDEMCACEEGRSCTACRIRAALVDGAVSEAIEVTADRLTKLMVGSIRRIAKLKRQRDEARALILEAYRFTSDHPDGGIQAMNDVLEEYLAKLEEEGS